VDYSFIDDMDLVQTGPSIALTRDDVIPLMQVALDLWEQGLHATGEAVPSNPSGTSMTSIGKGVN